MIFSIAIRLSVSVRQSIHNIFGTDIPGVTGRDIRSGLSLAVLQQFCDK